MQKRGDFQQLRFLSKLVGVAVPNLSDAFQQSYRITIFKKKLIFVSWCLETRIS
jgi:hypothetical protein